MIEEVVKMFAMLMQELMKAGDDSEKQAEAIMRHADKSAALAAKAKFGDDA